MSNCLIIIASCLIAFSQLTAQKSLIGLDEILLGDIFDNSSTFDIKMLTERDDDAAVLRRWIFDQSGRLKTESDYRSVGWRVYVGDAETHIPKITQEEFSYFYDEEGRLDHILKEQLINDEKIIIQIQYNYRDNQTVIESWSRPSASGHRLNDYQLIKTFDQHLIQSKVLRYKTHDKEYPIESINQLIYNYSAEGQLTSRQQYSIMGPAPIDSTELKLSSTRIYSYDHTNRLEKMEDISIDEHGQRHDNITHAFKYKNELNKPSEISLLFSGDDDRHDVIYQMEYDSDGFIRSLSIDDSTFHYEIIRRN